MRLLKIILLLLCLVSRKVIAQENKTQFTWSNGPAIPDADGFAGSYAGVSNNTLLVAGGANFPNNQRPWTNGVKTWYDKIFALEHPSGSWKQVGRLPRPMGYGISLTWKDGLVCLGGGDAVKNFTDAFILTYRRGKIETEALPQLPYPVLNGAGVLVGEVVYVLDEAHFFSLDLAVPAAKRSWQSLPYLPGPARMLAAAGTMNGRVFIFGGVLPVVMPDSSIQRKYLRDCWEYLPGEQWKRIADLPYALAASPTPAYAAGESQLLLFGGDDGSNASRVAELKDTHPGFRSEILAYNAITDSWSVKGHIPIDKKADSVTNPHESVYAPVTTPLVTWNHAVVLAGGEARPAVRSNKVLIAVPNQPSGRRK